MFAASVMALAVVAASGVAALPTLHMRQDPCAGIGGGAFSSANNFTLAALNSTVTDSQAVGAKLVVGQNGETDGKQFGVLSTYASYPYDQWPSMTLDDGALIPMSDSSAPGTDSAVAAGDMLGFVFSNNDLPEPASIYCGIADTDPDQGSPNPLLAVNGDADSFSLCVSGSGATAQNNIVYKPAAGNQEYDYDSCYAVKVQILGTD